MGVLMEAFFFGPGRVTGVPSPLDGDASVPFWWDHLAQQAQDLAAAGFSAIWLPPPQKGASGSFSSGYDLFDDYDLGSKNQKGNIPTRYGTRESLQRCSAMMCANGIDVYIDMVENQRDGDDGNFNFDYVDAFGKTPGGRFSKGPGDFHPHVPEDPGVFSDQFKFGRDLAPINGLPKDHCRNGLLDAASWLTRALDVKGFRMDNAKGVSTVFMQELLSHGDLAGKFAVSEFADGNIGNIESWTNEVQRRSAAFDFPLRFTLEAMCNAPESFDMASLDHAGLAGVDPTGAVTFVENHDTDRGGIGGPIVRNKELAYAYILTSEGYPCVFYRDYSTDKNCFGLKPAIDRLIAVREHFGSGGTQQRWKDNGLFAFERMGGAHLLVALNKDGVTRNITVDTGFPPNTALQDFVGHAPVVHTQHDSRVTLNVPPNNNGRGYVCYAPARDLRFTARPRHQTTQIFEGATDLDIKPAIDNTEVQVCRVFAAAGTQLVAHFSMNMKEWSAKTSIKILVRDAKNAEVASALLDQGSDGTGSLSAAIVTTAFHSISVFASALPAAKPHQGYTITLQYTAPQTL